MRIEKLNGTRVMFAAMAFVLLAGRALEAAEAEALHFVTEDGPKCWEVFMQGQKAYDAKDFKKYLELNQQALQMKLSAEALAEVQKYRTMAQYNVACGYALTGDKEKALEALAKAVDAGFDKADDIKKDDDLVSLRGDKRFKDLVDQAAKLAVAASNKNSFKGTLVRLEHAARIALLVPGKERGDAPAAALRLETDDKALQKKMEELLQKKSMVQVEGQGGTCSYNMVLHLSSIAAAEEPKK
ncbi:MAG: hypothetical protein HY291_09840 [Planctomycetes bacterium]|nr:hypothetical protein [Planctomycetota bacterium]